MNIFALHPDPAIAASWHCDQHLHKMILESAQMLSTAMYDWFPDARPFLYKPAYINHPCTQWVCTSKANALWVCKLMHELNEIRLSLGSAGDHASMEIANVFHSYITPQEYNELVIPSSSHQFIFCGPDYIQFRPALSIEQKYMQLYIHKFSAWLDTKRPMSYKNRPLPPFLEPYKDQIDHAS